jgi:hypothetical protein
MITYTPHTTIDRQKWDACIANSKNRLPYALSWWLDAVCPEWDALVQDDYLAVMPLTPGRKFRISYLYQPYFTQQLGVFSPSPITTTTITDFLNSIPLKYKHVQIQLNSDNNVQHTDVSFSVRKNFILDLTPSAIELTSNYHRNCRRNIQKAVHAGLTIKQGPSPSAFTHFIKNNLEKQLTGTRKTFYPTLLRITAASIQQSTGEIVGVYTHTGELVAAGWFITMLGRCLFQVCASTEKGKENQAMYMLVNHMITKNAGAGLVFDFAGSNIPGIAYFNSGFGSTITHYPLITRNLLPWPVKWLKR